jgi:uncharacterized protein DUF4154
MICEQLRTMQDPPRARGIRPYLNAAAALVACAALAPMSETQAREIQRSDALKAGYLFNFLKFVEWPPIVPADTLNACFLGNSGVYAESSARLSYTRVGARRVIARRLAPGDPIAGCQVLYIDAEQLPTVSEAIYTRPTALLTVSDAPDFLSHGGIIALFDNNHRLRFRISADNARLANVRISASLLQLASASPRPEQ